MRIPGLQDPAPGSIQFGDPALHIGLQPHGRQSEPGRLGHRVNKIRGVKHGRVVDKRRDRLTVMLNHGDHPSRPRFGKRDGRAPLIDIPVRCRQPVPDRQRPVTQGIGEPGPERARL